MSFNIDVGVVISGNHHHLGGGWGGVGGCDEECHTGMESVLLPFPPVVSWTLSLEAGLQNHTV